MSARWDGEEALLQPITPEQPCGDNLEDTELLASFDSYRLFGRPRSLDAPPDPEDKTAPPPPDWGAIRTKSIEALQKSKDLGVLAHLGAALLRTDGLPAFAATLHIASQWLQDYWPQVYPLIDEDAVRRCSALNNFADRMAMIDRLRRTPLVNNRQHGRFSLRDLEIATRQLQPAANDTPIDEKQINAAFDAMPLEELTLLHDSVAAAVAAVRAIEGTMRDAAGSEATPTFDPLSKELAKIHLTLRTRLTARTAGAAAPAGDAAAEAGEGVPGVSISGVVKSRQDAIRALEAITAFYRQAEPSSPIPLLLERAKRLVSKDFLEVLADIAPEALGAARSAGGLKDSQ
ncbi:MAG TPA: type VI secretion system protein TssA [Vicinamibacterales bacterium]|nr:type VI secretion system protein TssA [Vicinamibacterales bacterium]